MAELIGKSLLSVSDHPLQYNSSSPQDLATLPVGMWLLEVTVVIKTAFNTTGTNPYVQLGTSSSPSLYAQIDLTQAGTYVVTLKRQIETAETVRMTYVAASAGGTAGTATILLTKADPN